MDRGNRDEQVQIEASGKAGHRANRNGVCYIQSLSTLPQIRTMLPLKYLSAYSDQTKLEVAQLIEQNKLGEVLNKRYPAAHSIRTDKTLYQYVQDLKSEFLRNADPINKVAFDNKIHVINHALGLHTTISRVQGGKLKAKHEIRIATMFKQVPLEFLRMIAVHELAHVKEKNHDKSFYKLCCHMEPSYHQYEFDLRLYLTHIDLSGQRLWNAPLAS
jgi:predicted metal-dependent hydrolase